MHADQGKLIMIDAVDGAGKDTAARALATVLEQKGRRVHYFDTAADDTIPEGVDTLIVSEPTYRGIGAVIRSTIMKDTAFKSWSTAMAYALDREVLYRRVILPFLHAKPGRVVVQVCGLMSSLTYQTIQSQDEGNPLRVEDLMQLPGNQLELSRAPDLALLLTVSTETAQKRLDGRTDKVDADKFGDPRFQARVAERYRAADVRGLFEEQGTKIVEIDSEQSKEVVAAACITELSKVI